MIPPPKEVTPFIPGPVVCARNFPLVDVSGGQPVMAEAILDWFRPMELSFITTVVGQGVADPTLNGVVTEVERTVRTMGCVIQGSPEQLQPRMEGQRSWDTIILFVISTLNLDTNDVVRVKGVRYRVMLKNDYRENGFIRYELTEDYERTR